MTRTILVLALLLGGCGYKKQIESLQGQVVQRDGAIEAQRSELDAAAEKAARLEADIAEGQARIDVLEAELAQLNEAIDAEREKSSRILADRGALRSEVQSMKDALRELQERRARAEARVAQFQDLISRFKSLIDAGTLDVKIIDGRMVVVLASDVLFDSGSAKLSADGSDALAEVAKVLSDIRDRRFQVEGHTDNVPIRTQQFPSNWHLGAARAINVVDHLIRSGMTSESLSAASFADTMPVASNDDRETRSQNRRIEIVVAPDLSDLPGFEELQAL